MNSLTTQNFPDEVWSEILSRLPVKSLLRFRCLSKSLRSLIEHPYFCCSHLNSFKNNRLQSLCFVEQYAQYEQKCVVRCSKTFKAKAVLDSIHHNYEVTNISSTFRRNCDPWFVFGSLDGLVLLMHITQTWPISHYELALWNPSIRRSRILPGSATFSDSCAELGFGFNPATKDYMHVRLIRRGKEDLRSIAIYSVRTGSWRTIQYQDLKGSKWRWTFLFQEIWNFICCKGILYFTPTDVKLYAQELVSFNLISEVFASTSLPIVCGGVLNLHTLVRLDGGCSVGLIDVSCSRGCVWVLESSGTQIDSMYWTKRYTFDLRLSYLEYFLSKFLCIKKNGEMLVQWNKWVASFNLETQEEKTLMLNVPRVEMSRVFAYVESLLLLNG